MEMHKNFSILHYILQQHLQCAQLHTKLNYPHTQTHALINTFIHLIQACASSALTSQAVPNSLVAKLTFNGNFDGTV